MVGRLYHLGKARVARARRRAARALRAHRRRRPPRQDLLRRHAPPARPRAALVARPPVLFLDEPTTGLDPRSRLGLWETIEARVAGGHDRAADHAVPRRGRPARRPHRGDRPRQGDRRGHLGRAQGPRRRRAARGPPRGRRRRRGRAIAALAPDGRRPRRASRATWCASRARRARARSSRPSAGSTTPASGVEDIAIRRPTLDDVFIALTGRAAEDAAPPRRWRHERARRQRRPTRWCSRARNLLRIPRQPDLLIAFTIQPVMFVLLFVYVFGGAIQTPGYDYVDFLMPGIIIQSIAFGGFVTALGPLRGPQEGPDRPLPLAADVARRGAGRAHARRRRAQRAVARRAARRVGMIVGFDFNVARPARSSLGIVLLLLFGYAFSWIFALHRAVRRPRPRRRTRSASSRSSRSRSRRRPSCRSTRCRTACRQFAEVNPFTIVVDAVRSLWLGAPAGNDVWGAFAWSLGLIAVFAPLAVSRYRRVSTA